MPRVNSHSEAMAVRKVVLAWEHSAGQISDKPFVHAPLPKESTTAYQNCLDIVDFCAQRGINLEWYFILAFGSLGREWLKKTFGSFYPPFNVAISAKTLERVGRNWVTPKLQDKRVYLGSLKLMLDTYPPHLARSILRLNCWGLDRQDILELGANY